MNTLSIEGWCKPGDQQMSTPIGLIEFHVPEADHLRLEKAEAQLGQTHTAETMVDLDISDLSLIMPEGCAPLTDCQYRVFLSSVSSEPRGQFHLVGHREGDGSLIYTSAVMIDQLG